MKFNIGDRVAVYGGRERVVGIVSRFGTNESYGLIWVETDREGPDLIAHPNQLRKLKPKRKAREFWINVGSVQTYVHSSLESANNPRVSIGRIELIHVREVLPKKGAV